MMWRGDGIEVQTPADAGEDLFRDRVICRSFCRHAGRDSAAAELAGIQAGAGCGVGAVRAAVSRPQGRRDAADRCSRGTLRISRAYPDRPARRRDDPEGWRTGYRRRSVDQAAELLQYQIEKRLGGAARAQVAARLAMVYLINRKPDRAIAALRSTCINDLSGELAPTAALARGARAERRRAS